MSLTRTTTLSEVIRAGVDTAVGQHYHALPALVVAYYPETFEADIQIGVKDPRFDPETGERQDEDWPVYPRVKVAWPRANGFILAGSLAPADTVQVFFQDLDDSAFRASGQTGSAPVSTRRFAPDGAFCIPAAICDADIAADAAATASFTIVGMDGTQAQIRFNGTSIQLGATGSDFIALASLVAAELTKIATAFSTFIPGTGGASFPHPYTSPGNVASTLVKAQ